MAAGNSQVAYTSLTMPVFSPTRRVSSTVRASQTSSPANSHRWWAWKVSALAATPRTATSASTTMVTKATSQSGSSQIGQLLTPMLRPRTERTGVCLAATSTLNLCGGRHVLPSVPDCRDIGCRTSIFHYSPRLILPLIGHSVYSLTYSTYARDVGAGDAGHFGNCTFDVLYHPLCSAT